jgi:hypothetical protein
MMRRKWIQRTAVLMAATAALTFGSNVVTAFAGDDGAALANVGWHGEKNGHDGDGSGLGDGSGGHHGGDSGEHNGQGKHA